MNNTMKSKLSTYSLPALIMMTSVLLSRVLGVVRELVLANYKGTGPEMDAYVAAFTIPEVVNHLLAGGYLSITFIPIFQRFLVEEKQDRAWRFFSTLFSIGSVIMVILITIGMVFTEYFLSFMGGNIQSQLALTAHLTRIILPAQLFIYWGVLFMAVQFAHKRFFYPALAPLAYNAGIILGGVLLGRFFGIEGFCWGVLAGAFTGNVLFQLPGLKQIGVRIFPAFSVHAQGLKEYIVKTIPLILGAGSQFAYEVLFRFFGSYNQSGSIAALNYANRTMWVLIGVFGQALGVASFPFLAQLAAEKKFDALSKMSHQVVTRVIILIVPFSGLMIVLAENVIRLLFQHGAFTPESTLLTARVLRFCMIGAFAGSGALIVNRCFFAVQNTLFPMIVSTISVAISIPCYFLATRTMGPEGIALVGAVFMILPFLIGYLVWIFRHGEKIQVLQFFIIFAKVFAASTIGFGAGNYMKTRLTQMLGTTQWHFRVQDLLISLAVSLVYLIVTYGFLEFLGVVSIRKKILKLAASHIMRKQKEAALR